MKKRRFTYLAVLLVLAPVVILMDVISIITGNNAWFAIACVFIAVQLVSLGLLIFDKPKVKIEDFKETIFQKEPNEEEEIKDIAETIKNTAETRGWENAEYFAEQKYGKEKTQKAMKLTENEEEK